MSSISLYSMKLYLKFENERECFIAYGYIKQLQKLQSCQIEVTDTIMDLYTDKGHYREY